MIYILNTKLFMHSLFIINLIVANTIPFFVGRRKADSRTAAPEEIQPFRFQIKKDHTKLNKTKKPSQI
ncbi:hypothetical protein CA265_10880 [Sphingobacteriaceae bacterium GW460-11-11-14-LB5]|nr:hypothetical protein CA265_10880 [Sphingobacteriaceae bacterium GW460-11-11-14-LB5]